LERNRPCQQWRIILWIAIGQEGTLYFTAGDSFTDQLQLYALNSAIITDYVPFLISFEEFYYELTLSATPVGDPEYLSCRCVFLNQTPSGTCYINLSDVQCSNLWANFTIPTQFFIEIIYQSTTINTPSVEIGTVNLLSTQSTKQITPGFLLNLNGYGFNYCNLTSSNCTCLFQDPLLSLQILQTPSIIFNDSVLSCLVPNNLMSSEIIVYLQIGTLQSIGISFAVNQRDETLPFWIWILVGVGVILIVILSVIAIRCFCRKGYTSIQ